jgi:glycosyltransferase involved in cell wall biosynthesis
VPIQELSETGCLSFIKTIRTLRRNFLREDVDVLVAHSNRNTVPGIIAARLSGVPVVAMEHSVYGGLRSRIWRILRHLTYPLATFVVVLSRDQRSKYPGARVRVIPNPLENVNNRQNVRSKPAEAQLRILFAGRLERVKGLDRLIEICRHLTIPYHLDIVGSGSQETRARQLVSIAGIDSNVTFHGWQGQLLEFFDSADVIAVTSRIEGFGLVVIEAMSRGCVPIVYNVEGGLKDIIDDGVDGFLVQNDDVQGFAMRLHEIWTNRDRTREMASAGKSKSEAFRVDKVVQRWDRLLLNIEKD